MIDYLGDNMWVTFLTIAVILAIIEVFSLELVLLMFAVGAGAAAVASGLGAPIWAALLVFAIVSTALLFLVRPPLIAKLHDGPTLQQGHDVLVGQTAVVVEPVDPRGGRVQLRGELWSARALVEGHTFDTETEVLVTRIDGATAVVTSKES